MRGNVQDRRRMIQVLYKMEKKKVKDRNIGEDAQQYSVNTHVVVVIVVVVTRATTASSSATSLTIISYLMAHFI